MRHLGIADNGDVVDVVITDSDADELLMERWPPFGLRLECDESSGDGEGRRWGASSLRVSVSASTGRHHDVVVDGDGLVDVRVEGRDGVVRHGRGWDVVESELALFAAERLAGLVAVHAGVLVVSGRAVLLPGVSHAGKSTLCAAAMDAGVEVWSDEYALVDADGRVRGWPRALRVRSASGVVRRELPAARTDAPGVVGAVVSVRFDASVTATELRECGRLDAMTDVLMNTVCARRRPEEAFAAASSVTRDAVLLRGTRGEASEAMTVLLERLADPRWFAA